MEGTLFRRDSSFKAPPVAVVLGTHVLRNFAKTDEEDHSSSTHQRTAPKMREWAPNSNSTDQESTATTTKSLNGTQMKRSGHTQTNLSPCKKPIEIFEKANGWKGPPPSKGDASGVP
ncbi:hypothetical protein Ddc_00881 [Ditylenchus destructor]|nr:hypothetical protein Ddc_00881 [Ditylenchus destructor]